MTVTRSRRVGIAAAVAIAGATLLPGLATQAIGSGAQRADRRRPPTLVEAVVCSGVVNAPADRVRTSGQLAQTVAVRVPATVQLRVDHHRRILAASTNTGCAPRPGDDVYFLWPSGELTIAPQAVLNRNNWHGDFTQPGVFVGQRTVRD